MHGVELGFRSLGGTVIPFILSALQTKAGFVGLDQVGRVSYAAWPGKLESYFPALCEFVPGKDQYIRVESLGRCF